MHKVAVVLLNWNGRDLLEKFLPSVVQYSDNDGCIVVVADNGSTDDSLGFIATHYPSIQVVSMPQNYGFTGGYNRALTQVEAEYFLLLNTDVEVTPNWLDPLLQYMDNTPMAAACMPKIRSYRNKKQFEYAGAAGGFIDQYGYPFCRGRILSVLEEDSGQYDTPIEVFWTSGACMLIRSDLYKQAGGFDEAFFAHMEEIDLCWRIKRMGYHIACIPQSTVYHVGGATLDYRNPRKLYLNHRNNLYMMYKNLPKKGFKRTIFRRMVLDGLSGIGYLLSFKFGSLCALLRAHRDYYRHKSTLKEERKRLQQQAVIENPLGIYPHSIVRKFFGSRKRLRFHDLNFNETSE